MEAKTLPLCLDWIIEPRENLKKVLKHLAAACSFFPTLETQNVSDLLNLGLVTQALTLLSGT